MKTFYITSIVLLLFSYATFAAGMSHYGKLYYEAKYDGEMCGLEVMKCEGEDADKQWGVASWYDYKLITTLNWDNGVADAADVVEIGVPCFRATEECYTTDKKFAASRKYERGSVLKVTNFENNRSVEVVVTDYIEHPKRVIDLTSGAFQELAPLEQGLVDVRIEKIGHEQI